MDDPSARAFLRRLFDAAIAAADPAKLIPRHLPAKPSGRTIVVGAGKASAAMARAFEQHWTGELSGLVVTRYGHSAPCKRIEVVEAAHPVPDARGEAAARRILELVKGLTEEDLVVALISGGGSALSSAPAEGLSLADKQAVNRALLASGASIDEINCVRKHLSAIKGGRLAVAAYPSRVVALLISDVPGDDPAVIGSGPTVPDPTTLADARAVVARFGLAVAEPVRRALADPANESPKPGDPVFANTSFRLIARPADAFRAAEAAVRAQGYDCIFLGDRVEGEAREVAAAHGRLARCLQAEGRRAVVLSGGELTVTMAGTGRGGPNQEYALALAQALGGASGIAAVAGDTDGTDGGGGSPDDPAGAFIDQTTLARAAKIGLDPAAFLADNDSTGFFERLGDLLDPGPTFTNVNDFRAILVDMPSP
jgi:glycerate 2-kinase